MAYTRRMNVTVLIDAIVRQTTVLVAQLATAGGIRAPLANVANQVFIQLVDELKAHGLGQKVIADMFGMALRTYKARVQRLRDSATLPGRTLWRAIHDYIANEGVASKAQILQRFRYDDEAIVRSVLRDLHENGIAFQTGRGDAALFRLVSEDDLKHDATRSLSAAQSLLWVVIHRFGPLTESEIMEHVPLDSAVFEQAIAALLDDGRVSRQEEDDTVTYQADAYRIPMGSPNGWEAAVFDHYQAVVTTLSQKVGGGHTMATMKDVVGGSTFCYDLWDEHPQSDEVEGLLAEFRARCFDVQGRVEEHAAQTPEQDRRNPRRVTVYVGQSAIRDDEDDDE